MIFPENHFILLVLCFSSFAFIFSTFNIIVGDKFLDFSRLELRNVLYFDSNLIGQVVEGWRVVNKPLGTRESPLIKILQSNEYKDIKLDSNNEKSLNNYLNVLSNWYGLDKNSFILGSENNRHTFYPLKSLINHTGESLSIFKYVGGYAYNNPKGILKTDSSDIKEEELKKPLVLDTLKHYL